MAITDKEVRTVVVLGIIVATLVLAFIVLKPLFVAISTALLLAYILNPVYKKLLKVFRERNITALAVSILLLLVVFIPIWFITPLVIRQAFQIFTFLQTLNVQSFIAKIFTGTSLKFQADINAAIVGSLNKLSAASLESLTNFLLNVPTLLLHIGVLIFVFFFALRDGYKLKGYVLALSPFTKEKEQQIVRHFREITYSIIFGYIVVGIIQGIATGLGLFVFGVPNAIVLTFLAILASLLPMVGSWLIWIPAAVYLFTTGQTGMAIGFSLYSVLIVSTIDNILRSYIVAKRTQSSAVVVLVGMIGGFIVFGVLGLMLGPLILAYAILFIEAYKDKTLSSMFTQS